MGDSIVQELEARIGTAAEREHDRYELFVARRHEGVQQRAAARPAVLRVPYYDQYGESAIVLPLEERCRTCTPGGCSFCNGEGYVLSPNGRALLAFVQRYGGAS